MSMLCSIANSFLRVIMLVRTKLTNFAMPIIPIIILNAPPIVMEVTEKNATAAFVMAASTL